MKPWSASEVNTARGCLRKWAFTYATDLPRPPPNASAALGLEGHAIAEAYLRDGTAPSAEGLGALVRAGLPHLPPPGTGEAERREYRGIDGVPFVMVFDWRGLASHLPDTNAPEGAIGQLDHKFSKDPSRYGMWTEAQYLTDPQTIIYRVSEGDVPVVQRWVYYPTGTARPRVKPADRMLSYTATREAYKRVVLPVLDAVEPWRGRKVDPMDVPPNPGHCDAFGGCYYKREGLCKLSLDTVTTNIFGGNMASIWDKISVNGPSTPSAAAPPAPTPAPADKGFQFTFPAEITEAAPKPTPAAPPVPPPAAVEAPPAPVEAPAPKRRAAVKPEPPAVAESKPARPDDTLERIGRALIAAGRVLTGEQS